MIFRRHLFLALSLTVLVLTGCVTPKSQGSSQPPQSAAPIVSRSYNPSSAIVLESSSTTQGARLDQLGGNFGKVGSGIYGFYHTVQPKETLYRISKQYDVSIEDIVAANNISDPTKINKGERLLIPSENYNERARKGEFVSRGIYHVVQARETLYRISKDYGVSLDAIKRANRIKDASRIQKGTRLFIPKAQQFQPMRLTKKGLPKIPLYKNTGRWKYIVIHHTATLTGDKQTIEDLHKRRGFGELGYHFVIDNGTSGRPQGLVEVGSRWYKQKHGAHAKANNMNEKGIGIALIGNFSEEEISREQLMATVQTVDILRRHYGIPTSRILGHRQVKGAATECPGKYFPWDEFEYYLKTYNSNA